MRAITTCLALPILALVAHAGDQADPGRPARLLETLVRQAVRGPDVVDPSPTRLVADLLREDRERVRAVLRDAWDSRHLLAWDAARALEEVTQLLYGLGPDGKRAFGPRPSAGGLWEHEGVVLVKLVPSGERWNGPFEGEDLPAFDAHLGSREMRAPPRPDAKRLWTAIEAGTTRGWSEAERVSFMLALGEAAREDAAVRASLLDRARRKPRRRLFSIALAALGGPEATAALRDRLVDRVPRDERELSEKLRELARGLTRTDPRALVEAVLTLDDGIRTRAMSSIGLDLVLPVVVLELEEAVDREARRAVLFRARDVARESMFGRGPSREMPRLVRCLVAALDEVADADRELVLEVVSEVLRATASYPITWSFEDEEGSIEETGRCAGPAAGVEWVLRAFAADTEAGRFVHLPGPRRDWFREPPVLLSPPPEPLGDNGDRAHGDAPHPRGFTEPDPRFPVHVSARPFEGGLRLTIRNLGTKPFLVNPLALRYAAASLTTLTAGRRGQASKSRRQLKLQFGRMPGDVAVPASELREVAPGGTYSWEVPLLPAFRAARNIVISLVEVPVVGRTSHPVLLALNDSWIR